jgi:tRNA C32,U32 (ribose-2'-O)-methylase TrmJ
LVSNIGKKEENTKIQNNDVKSYTNSEQIKDFYEYTSECLKRISFLRQPTQDEIRNNQIQLNISKTELGGKNKKI